MQRFWKVAGIATLIAVLGVAVFGVAAFAQDDDGSPFDFHARFKAAVAEILGVTVEEYDAAVEQAHDQVVDEAVTEGWLTEDQAERMRERMEEVPGAWGGGKGFMGPRDGFMGRGGDAPTSVAAEKLGMEESDLLAELRDGKSIADLAAEKGVDLQVITDAYLEQLGETLNQAVQDGKITQNQADSMLEQAKERLPDMLNNAWEGRRPGGFMGRGVDSPVGVAAEKLDMTVSDLMAELQNGKSIADLAAEKGVDLQEISDAYLEQLGENLNQAVQDGKITQSQADSMLEQAKERVPEMLNNTWEGRGPGRFPPGGFPGGHPGRMGYPGASDA